MRVRALFKQLRPRAKAVEDGAEEDDDSVEVASTNADGTIDWTKYETKGDFLVVPQRAVSARQRAIKQAGGEKERTLTQYDALDDAEKKKQ